jgi:AcrR family transcriptional regulator
LRQTVFERLEEETTGRPVARAKPSAARDRILAAADELFYRHGIRTVGIDRIISAADVTRVTFYRHFASKDHLVDAYLRKRGDRLRERIAEIQKQSPQDPREILNGMALTLAADIEAQDYNGCEFVNAAAEYEGDDHPVRILGANQRAWLRAIAAESLARLGYPSPDRVAAQLIMLRMGATVISGLDPEEDNREAFLEAWDHLLDAARE